MNSRSCQKPSQSQIYHSTNTPNEVGTAVGTEYGSNARNWTHSTPTIGEGEANQGENGYMYYQGAH